MFKQSRRKIVASIMSILVVIWIVTLCAIYIFSYHEVTTRNREMLKEHLAQYKLNMSWDLELFENKRNDMPSYPGMPSQPTHAFQDKPTFKLEIGRAHV